MYPSVWQILIVLVVVLLLFGRGKISGLMAELAQGIKGFKKGMQDDPEIAETQTDSLKSEATPAPDEALVEKEKAAKG
ncbi:MAG: twin-arginine translocase TatA/TatE family subunit [Alphaproteobacteria bacterium]|nr:twin-arginine translocase TatA/TatE family subunit [Alphaproteobacteria bacterium]